MSSLMWLMLTDPDSRAMRSGKGPLVGYNVQIAVDVKHRLIAERQVFYTVQRTYETGGSPAPARPRPRRAHKLGAEVVEALRAAREQRPSRSFRDLVKLVRERFELSVHPGSIDRVLARQKNARERRATGLSRRCQGCVHPCRCPLHALTL